MKVNELSWVIGGAQGSGVDSSATAFGKACAFGGLHVYGKREYYSNIKGEHSYFQVRLSARPIRSHLEYIHLLATFDAETVFRHALDVNDDGAIIYDAALERTRMGEVPTLEPPVVEGLAAYLGRYGLGDTLGDVLQASAKRGVTALGVPFNDFLREVALQYDVDQISKIARMVNLMAVGASFGLLGFPYELLERAVRDVFRAKARVADMNVLGARRAYDFAREGATKAFAYRLEALPLNGGERLFLLGNQAVALGKLAAGCRFQTYYPITPASDESEFLEAHDSVELRPDVEDPMVAEAHALGQDGGSLVVMQTEDEIAAITMATGAALTGTRASTSTSGPGFCLMMEGLGWAGINEVPVVVTLYQRCGPATGMPTRHEQGDLRFALHAGHGDFPRIILASADMEEAFVDVVRSFNYAERYQLPVIHLVDKALANSSGTVARLDPSAVKIERGALIGDGAPLDLAEPYKRFKFTESGISPRAVLGMPGTIFWNTGDEHDEMGHITENPQYRVKMMDKRMGKLALAAREIPDEEKYSYFGSKKPEAIIVSWGSTKGAILDAMDRLKEAGHNLGFLQLRLLHPFPTEAVTKLLKRSKLRIGVEMNYSGQLIGIIRENTGMAVKYRVLKYNGRPISEDELVVAFSSILKGGAPERTVLTRGT